MFRMRPIGAWKKIRRLMRTYEPRVKRLERVVVRDLAESIMKDIKDAVPDDPSLQAYKDSLKVVQLYGLPKGAGIAYAIVADNGEMDIADLPQDLTVVYVTQKAAKLSLLSELAIENSPWVLEKLPSNMDSRQVQLIHRQVTKEEVNRVRERNKTTLLMKSPMFARAGGKFETKSEEIAPSTSTPDLAFRVMRMELGIGQKRDPHWKPAINRTEARLRELFMGRSDYIKYLTVENFTGWAAPMKRLDKMSVSEFQSIFGGFQKKVAS